MAIEMPEGTPANQQNLFKVDREDIAEVKALTNQWKKAGVEREIVLGTKGRLYAEWDEEERLKLLSHMESMRKRGMPQDSLEAMQKNEQEAKEAHIKRIQEKTDLATLDRSITETEKRLRTINSPYTDALIDYYRQEPTIENPPAAEGQPLTERQLDLAMEYLFYGDVMIISREKVITYLKEHPSANYYAREFEAMVDEYGETLIKDFAQANKEEVLKGLEEVGILSNEQSPADQSISWPLWHAAKLRFLSKHPEIQHSLPNAREYSPADPLLHWKVSFDENPNAYTESIEAEREDIRMTHLGWEIYENFSPHRRGRNIEEHLDPDTPQSAVDSIKQLLNEQPKPQVDTLSSYKLRKLGLRLRLYHKKVMDQQPGRPEPQPVSHPPEEESQHPGKIQASKKTKFLSLILAAGLASQGADIALAPLAPAPNSGHKIEMTSPSSNFTKPEIVPSNPFDIDVAPKPISVAPSVAPQVSEQSQSDSD